MERTYLRVKEWFEEKEQQKAKGYNIWFNVTYKKVNGIEMIDNTDGYITLDVTILAESEKAVKVHIESGHIVGSYKGWTTWIPKSCIAQ